MAFDVQSDRRHANDAAELEQLTSYCGRFWLAGTAAHAVWLTELVATKSGSLWAAYQERDR
jgi:hypothetical protein